jgi:hypothetical protein
MKCLLVPQTVLTCATNSQGRSSNPYVTVLFENHRHADCYKHLPAAGIVMSAGEVLWQEA